MDGDIVGAPTCGAVAGGQDGTPGMAALERIGEVAIRPFDDPEAAFIALNERAIDAVVCDLVTAARRVRAPEAAGPPVKIVGDPLTEELYGIVLPQGDVDQLERVNVALDAIRVAGLSRELADTWLR